MDPTPATWTARVLDWGRGGERPTPLGSLAELIDESVRTRPDALATVTSSTTGDPGAHGRLRYAELADLAARLAGGLRRHGVEPGDRVAVVAARGPLLVPTVLAVLRIGAAYVPLDPRAPTPRWSSILATSGATTVVGPEADLDRRDGLPAALVVLEHLGGDAPDPTPADVTGDDEAYVIFTSGSTGTPKGVSVSHANALARLESYRDDHRDPHVALLHTSLCFDAALVSLLPVLATGGTLVVGSDRDADDPAVAAASIAEHGVTFVAAVPSWYSTLLDLAPPGALRTLRRVVTGGEAMPPALVERHRQLLPSTQLVNEYGPTEATIAATAFEVPDDWRGANVPVGRPHRNTSIYVVDAQRQLVAPGVSGEVWIGGAGVADGYLGRPDDPAFVDDPFAPGRAYRTGDLGRWNADGLLELVGRADRQVKIRGERVEPDETEVVLLGMPDVAQAAVEVDRSGRAPRLVGYVAPSPSSQLEPERVRARLAERLPPAQVPALVVVLDRLPLTVGGKVDRRALPAPETPDEAAPQEAWDETERVVVRAVREVLGRDAVGLETDFHVHGGDSLAAARVVARLRRDLGVAVSPADLRSHPTPGALAAVLRSRPTTGRAIDRVPAVPRAADGSWRGPASHAATSFWYLEQEEGRAGGSNLVEVVRIAGASAADVERALAVLVDRHEGLRTSFSLGEDSLDQVVHPRGSVTVPVEPLAEDGATDAVARRAGARPFDLARPPLARVAARDTSEGVEVVLVVHHAIADGWAIDTLVSELVALATGQDVPERSIDAVDVARWVEARIAADGGQAAAEVRSRLAECAELTRQVLPYDRRSRDEDHHATAHRTTVDGATTARLVALGEQVGASLFSVVLASLGTTLRRLGGPDDLVIGAATGNRPLPEVEPVVACVTNFVPLRVPTTDGAAVGELLRRVDAEVSGSEDWGWLPVEAVLGERTSDAGLALPDVMISMLRLQPAPDGVERRGVAVPHVLTDLDVVVLRDDEGLRIEVHHDPRHFDAETIDRLVTAWTDVIAGFLQGVDHPLEEILAPTAADLAEAAELGGAAGEAPVGTVMDLLDPAVHPADADSPALVAAGTTTTWAELRTQVGCLAASLAADGVGPGDAVVIAADGAPGIVALLATWWSGATAVPLGDRQPDAKVAAIAERTSARLVLRAADVGARIAAPTDETPPPRRPVTPDDVAYVLFTSGSTGEPKGVVVSHRALRASTSARAALYPSPPPVALLTHDLAFDAGIGVAVWYLTLGGTLVTTTHEERLDPLVLARLVDRHGVGQLDLVPSHLLLLLDHAPPDALGSVELVTVGAESCPPALVARHVERLPRARLVNEYGPTEATVGTVAHECTVEDGRAETVPIGLPMAHTVARVADRSGRPLPRVAPGELLLGGHLLADGYLDDPELTADRFIEADGRRWYRTGDRVRWTSSGELEFLGRLDDQLKVRGYRIEPGEVEAVLRGHPDVSRVAVGARPVAGGEPALVAWVEPRPGATIDATDLLAKCRTRLPEWMVPTQVTEVTGMPLTTSGKVDRARLPDPTPVADGRRPPTSAQTPTQKVVVGVWEALLNRPVGMTDNFFPLGGHSLLAARLVAELTAHLGVPLLLSDLLEEATPAHLSAVADERLRAGPTTTTTEATLTVLRDGTRAPLVIVARDGETSLYLRHVLRSLDPERPLWLVMRPMPPVRVRTADLAAQGREVATVLAASGVETVHLLGHSASGLVVLAAAEALGPHAGRVILLDTISTRSLPQRLKHPLHRLRRRLRDPDAERAARAETRDALRRVRQADRDPHAERLVRDDQDERGFMRLRGRAVHRHVDLLAAEDTRRALGPDLGWGRWCTDLSVHDLPGDHFGVLLPPHVDDTVAALDRILAGAP